MQRILAMILAGGRVGELSVLTHFRPKSAVPFGGLYRVIDFPLSNLMHSGIENVGILSQYRSFSLINHIGNGSAWEMVGRDRSAKVLPPFKAHGLSHWYRGTADAVYQNLDFIRLHHPELVLILSGDHVYSMNYGPMIQFHRETSADLTVAFIKTSREQVSRFGIGRIDEQSGDVGGPLIDYVEKPKEPPDWPEGAYRASLTIYLFSTATLFEVLENHARTSPSSYEFGRDIITGMIDKYRVFGYNYNGYWGYTRTVDEYWRTNMDMLGDQPLINPEQWQVRTNLEHNAIRDRVPARIGPRAVIENSLIYNGCKVNGRVKNSILFPGVEVAENAEIEDSILIFDSKIGSGSAIHKTITDAEVEIGNDCEIGNGDPVIPNDEYPQLLKTGITIVGHGASIPDGCKIGCNCIVDHNMSRERFRQQQYQSGVSIR